MQHPVIWAEVDLAAIARNVEELRRVSRPARFMAVVKANGYGHGAESVARTALENGADMLGVARIDEAMALRKAGIFAPILILGYTLPQDTALLIQHDLTQTVYETETASAYSRIATSLGKRMRVHLKIDTGMGRLGLLPHYRLGIFDEQSLSAASDEALAIADLPGISAEGIFTHFAASDSADKTSALTQFALFKQFLDILSARGLTFSCRHAANSAAIIDLPQTHLDMVRAGIAMYGLRPSPEVNLDRVRLQPAMALKAKVSQVKSVGKGFAVSYGMTHVTQAPTRIATIALGYADGYSRLLSSRGTMLVSGHRVPVIGRICMDQTMLEIGDLPATTGSEVVIFGKQGDQVISVDDIAGDIGTINYEVVTSIAARVPRLYL